HPEPAGACTYSSNWQSALSPELTPPAKSHQPQKPKLSPVVGKLKVPCSVVCQFAFPYAPTDAAETNAAPASTATTVTIRSTRRLILSLPFSTPVASKANVSGTERA